MNTVTIYPCEIVKPDATEVITRERVEQMLLGVNDIFQQVGLQFVSEDVVVVTNENWSKNGLSDTQVGRQIRNIMQGTGGLEVYFIDGTIEQSGRKQRTTGSYTMDGIIIKKTSHYTTLAHEIGHACGWHDIYDYFRQPNPDGSFTKSPLAEPDNNVSQDSLSLDWGCYSTDLTQSDLIRRLLMFGDRFTSKGDIPSGSIYGVGRTQDAPNGRTGLIHVGSQNIFIRSPHSR